MTVGTAMGYAAGYEITEYWGADVTTFDGAWTTTEEWAQGEPHYMGTPQMGLWIFQLDPGITFGTYNMNWLVEFADNTQDAGDIIQICVNPALDNTSPQAGTDFKIEIQGLTTEKVYEGTGSGWTETTAGGGGVVEMQASVTTSAHDPAHHVIAEFSVDKGTLFGGGAPPQNFRVACYDATTDAWTAWPPESSADNPSTWGIIMDYSADPFPEGLTIGLMLALSSLAAVVSLRYFKKPKL